MIDRDRLKDRIDFTIRKNQEARKEIIENANFERELSKLLSMVNENSQKNNTKSLLKVG